MKKILAFALAALLAVGCFMMTGCAADKIIVQTNAYFAPFEYYVSAEEIDGVDVISKATDTSNAVKEAIKAALAQANG